MLPAVFGENLFDDFFDDAFLAPVFHTRNPLYGKNAAHIMKTDIREKDGSYELDVDLPGFKKDEVQLNLENGYLTISLRRASTATRRRRARKRTKAAICAASAVPAAAAAASTSRRSAAVRYLRFL